jgi:hypothetical protein
MGTSADGGQFRDLRPEEALDRIKAETFPPLEPEREALLRQRNRGAFAEEPRRAELERRLLDLGGLMALLFLPEPQLAELLDRGRDFPGTGARVEPSLPSACHANVARLFLRTEGAVRVATGYALSAEDGLWRQHSWGVAPVDERVVETTECRLRYYGIVLDDDEVPSFVLGNIPFGELDPDEEDYLIRLLATHVTAHPEVIPGQRADALRARPRMRPRPRSIARCRCGKTKRLRGHRKRFTCPECLAERSRERAAMAVEIRCVGCGRVQRVPAQRVRNSEPCDGYTCGAYGRCKQDPQWEPPRPIEKMIGWHLETGWPLDGGFHSYRFVRDTVEDIAACWRACEIRDAGLRQLAECVKEVDDEEDDEAEAESGE